MIYDFVEKDLGYKIVRNQIQQITEYIDERIKKLSLNDLEGFKNHITSHPTEKNNLIQLLSVNVSSFFRNPLTFEYLSQLILPQVIEKKRTEKALTFKIWSAGCSSGEEAYTIAIILHNLLQETDDNFNVNIFASDINETVIKKAENASFGEEQINDVKHGLLKKYFKLTNNKYVLDDTIKKMVTFSIYDLIDPKTFTPPESVFGNYDLIFCRNTIIYFSAKKQGLVFDKLYRALSRGGYLILGESESLPDKYKRKFSMEDQHFYIYQKH